MISLKEVTIHKYKSIESDQIFEVDKDVTVLVGMNESGKTAILEAIAKTHYFEDDKDFKFNTTHDYPRKEKKSMGKSGDIVDAVTCRYVISNDLLGQISSDLGEGVFIQTEFSWTKKYNNKGIMKDIRVNNTKFISNKTREFGISSKTLNEKLNKVKTIEDLNNIINDYKEEEYKEKLSKLEIYYKNEWKWSSDPLNEYIARIWLKPNLPKFLYYDEYYSLPSRISIEKLQDKELDSEDEKTAKALFDLADINIDELINSDDFEDYKAELEATEVAISRELFEFWSTNKNLEIQFDIDKVEQTDSDGNKRIVEHILDVRVRNTRAKVSLPLGKRSKGFNWFFSFLVWFKKIQEDTSSNYILLLDEPGLNLHASAQADLLKFIEYLSDSYQILYTTHSPFMVDPLYLNRVRTVVETDDGSVLSDSIQENDPNTLFPLQAALGYDIAQNLFISKNNLLVEGVSDLIFLQVMSSILQEHNGTYLSEDITIVPVGGLDKVSTFVSLLRGTKLNMVCLLDSSIDTGSRSKIENLIKEKIIHESKILYFDEFVDGFKKADIEDIFTKLEYLQLFNKAFNEYSDIKEEDLNPDIERIIIQIKKYLDIERFNHYRPANTLARIGADASLFSKNTLDRFEKLYKKVNSLF